MARSNIVFLAALLIGVLSSASAVKIAGNRRVLGETEPLAPGGWWQSINTVDSKTGKKTWCGLRDFPPIPDGYGSSRMLCGGYTTAYDPYWVWGFTKVGTMSATTSDNLKTGDAVYMRIFNPMLTYCQLRGVQVRCGVEYGAAAEFQIFKAARPSAAGEALTFGADEALVLRAKSGFCRVSGKGNSAYINCDQATAATATTFNMPYSHYYSTSLTSKANSNKCGANFIPLNRRERSIVNCSTANVIPSNYYTSFVTTARVPGTRDLISGQQYSFKSFDDLYHYQVSIWFVNTTDSRQPVISRDNDTSGDKVWFTVDSTTNAAGTPLANGELVTLRFGGNYCWLENSDSNGSGPRMQMRCDKPSLPTGNRDLFLFTLTIA